MSNKYLAALSLDVPARQCDSQIEPQIAGAAAISGALATPQGAAVGRWLAAFVIATGLAAVAFFGTGFLLVTYTWDEMLATKSETAMATAVIPPMQTNAEAARETPQTETISEATPPMQTNAEAARETPQTETISEATPIPLVQTFRTFQRSLNQLASPVEVASLPRLRPFSARTAKGRIIRHIQPATGQGVILKQYRDAAAPAPARPMDAGRVITRQGANVHDTPTRSTVLRTVPRETVLQVFARRDGWMLVGQDVPMGWVYSSLLTDAP